MKHHILLLGRLETGHDIIHDELKNMELEYNIHQIDDITTFKDYRTHNHPVDLILLNNAFKGSFEEIAQNIPPYLPIIVLIENTDNSIATELIRKGAADVITKDNFSRLGRSLLKELLHTQKHKDSLIQDRFQVLIEQGGDVMVILNEEGFPKYISPSVQKIFGYAPREAQKIGIKTVTHPADFKHLQKGIEACKANPGTTISTPPVRMKLKDGNWRWFKSDLTDLRHEPAVNGIVDNLRDVHTEVIESRINKLMLMNTEENFLLLDRDLNILRFNKLFQQNYLEIYGKEVQVGDFILDYAEPERRELLKKVYARVFEGNTVEEDFSVDVDEGTQRYFNLKFKPAYDEEHQIIGSFISIIETTEEQLAKQELAENEARFRALVESGGDIQLILNKDGSPKYASPSIQHVLGYSEQEATNLDMVAIAHPDDIPLIRAEIQKCLEKPGIPMKVPPARLKDKKGNWHWFEGTITNLLDNPAIEGIVDNFREVTERIEAEEVILKAKNQYQSLVQTINGVVWESNPETLLVSYISPQSAKMLGYDPETWENTPGFWANHLHPEDREQAEKKYKQEISQARNHELEYRFKKSDGSYLWIRDIISIITKDGKPVTIRGLMTDITEEKELELKLEQAYELSKIGVWQYNFEEEELYLSEYVRKIFEFEEDKDIDLRFTLTFCKEEHSKEKLKGALERAIREGIPFDEELLIETKTGKERWIRIVGKPDFADGKCIRIYGNTQNITERKTAQLDKEEAEQKYRDVVEHSTNMFYKHDTRGILSYVSPQSQKFLGYPPQQAMRNWTDFITDHPQNAKGEKITQKAIETGKTQPPYELQLRTADDRIIWVEVHEAPIKEKGKVKGIAGSLTDITERKQYETQTQLRYQASQFFKEKDHLNPILENLLEYLAEYNTFSIAEIWLKSANHEHLNLISTFGRTESGRNFYRNSDHIQQFKFGEGLPGTSWKSQSIEIWDDLPNRTDFVRHKAAAKNNIQSACALPLFYNGEPISVLLFGCALDAVKLKTKIKPYEILQDYLGAEIRRKQQEEELLLLFESSPDILAIIGQEEKFVRVNPAFIDILGYTEEELTTLPFTNFIHPEDLDKTNEEYSEAITGQRNVHNFINRWVTKSGETRWISWSSSEVFGEDGFVFTFGRDVSERMKLEELLNEVQRMGKIGGWEIDLQTNELYWSSITKEIYEVEQDYEPDLETSSAFIEKSEHSERIKKAVQRSIADGTPWDEEVLIQTHAGHQKWIRSKGKAAFQNEKCVRLYGSVQDIHDKKEAELQLEKTLKEKENILESIGDGFFTLDKNWNVTYWNRAAEQLLQTPKQKILDKNLWDVFEQFTDLPTYTNYHRVMHQRKAASFEDYYTYLDKWFDINAYPSPEGISVFFKDITGRKKAQAQLKQLNLELEVRAQELAASNEELEQFAYVASHDLQEPLRMVTSFLTQLDKKYSDQLDEKANKYIYFAVDGAQRMRQIILDLLNYSRLNQDKNRREEVDLNVVFDEVKALEHSHIEETGASIISDPLPTIIANPNTIKHVFQNLLNNALKYQQPESQPEIEVRCFELQDYWKFMIKDNGIGIKKEFIDTIFQIFKRLHTRDQYSGTGIGLAITKKVIERHGGEIWVESQEDKGSSFFFTLEKEAISEIKN